MRIPKSPMTPLAAVAAGLLAGRWAPFCTGRGESVPSSTAAGAVPRARSRRSSRPSRPGTPLPTRGRSKRVIEGFAQRTLPDGWAWPVSTAMHWGYGSSAAALYGILAGSARRPRARYGLPFGAGVWAAGYVVLPEAGLYKPI